MTEHLRTLRGRWSGPMPWVMTILIALILALTGCFDSDEQRRELVELSCDGGDCRARWSDSQLWSRVVHAGELDSMPEVDPSTLWACDSAPDVDTCVQVDSSGHVGCFWVEGDWAVAVYPSCATEGFAVGCGMSVSTLAR